MNNSSKFVKTVIKIDDLMRITGNKFKVLATKPYEGKNDIKPGITLDLLILEDNAPAGYYGTKPDGSPKEGIMFQNIRVTVCNGEKDKSMADLKAGDDISLYDFDENHSYFIDYNMILRFGRYEKVGAPRDGKA